MNYERRTSQRLGRSPCRTVVPMTPPINNCTATSDSVLASTSIWVSNMIQRLVSTAWTFTAACESSLLGRRARVAQVVDDLLIDYSTGHGLVSE